jgi:predicted RNA-binding Zn-ribbon protein involved in translation (DUF1610 family)
MTTDIKHKTEQTASSHTPGPWEHDGTGMVYGQPEDETGGSRFVCDVVQDGQREWMDDTEKANARLIAASPELLEAVQELMGLAEREGWIHIAINKARAAIAKARGASMSNDNCLAGIKCPECGNVDRFLIVATIVADVTDDGADMAKHSDMEWDKNSHTRCPDCGKGGTLAEFCV